MVEQLGGDRIETALPIACTLSADEQAAWSAGIGRTVLEGSTATRELADGYAFRYPGDERWARTLIDFVVHERDCCPFLIFGLTFEPDHGAIWLALAGGGAIKEFVAALMEAVQSAP